ncbi:hypothetical protein BDV12DRAFT_209560 [Aspergillus spectabilis]
MTQEELGAVHSGPAGSGNAAHGSHAYREKQQLERYLNFSSSLAFSACLPATWESADGSIKAGLANGGPSSIAYGIIFSAVGNPTIACSLAELASIHPTAGAQYYWSYFLAPRGRQFISFFPGLPGWVAVFSWSALVCIAPYFIGAQIEGMISLAHPGYEIKRWRGTLLMWAVALIPILINTFARRILRAIEVAAGIMHVIFLPVTIAAFAILAPRNPDSFVWDTFASGLTGWENSGVIFSVGLLGVDGIIHMAEEVKNAKVVVLRSMIYGTLINGALDFSYLLLSFPPATPLSQLPIRPLARKQQTFVLIAMGMLPGWIALFSGLASVTRLSWAFAQENDLLFSDFFARVDPTYKIPPRALFLIVSSIIALSFTQIGSTAAFKAILSLSTLGLYILYLIPLLLLALKRFTAPQVIPQGTFSLGKCICHLLPFPAELPVTGLVLGFVMLFACVDWVDRGPHKWEGRL